MTHIDGLWHRTRNRNLIAKDTLVRATGMGQEDGDDEWAGSGCWTLEITDRRKAQGAGRKVVEFCHLIALG